MDEIQDYNIAINTKRICDGDVFFCFKEAERYLTEATFKRVKCLFCENGFFERNKNLLPKISADFQQKINEVAKNDRELQKILVEKLQQRYQLPKTIIAITGTKGKTSTSWYTAQLLAMSGINCGYVGTIGCYFFAKNGFQKINKNDILTTPDIDELYCYLDSLVVAGADAVVFEASSHGLSQHRIDGISVNCSCFTNFSQDHLDFHKTMEEYFNAKMLLFKEHQKQNDIAILNADEPKIDKILSICQQKNIQTFLVGTKENSDLIIKNCELKNDTQEIELSCNGNNYVFSTKILGNFQASNIAQAIAICHKQFNLEIKTLAQLASSLIAPLGRMQRVENTNIFIDFAHTPKSLEESISLAKQISKNVVVIFGCGGDRDKQKRPIMFEVAKHLASYVIITDDNIRTEKSEDIIEDILCFENAKKNNDVKNPLLENQFVKDEIAKIRQKYNTKSNANLADFTIIPDRKQAIIFAIKNFFNKKDTIILIAGKGHETYQIISTTKTHFSDYEEAIKAIQDLKN